MAEGGVSRRATIEVPINADVSKLIRANEAVNKLVDSAERMKKAFGANVFKNTGEDINRLSKQMDTLKRSAGSVSKTLSGSDDSFKRYSENAVKSLDTVKSGFNATGEASRHFSDEIAKSARSIDENQNSLKKLSESYRSATRSIDEDVDKVAHSNDKMLRSSRMVNSQRVSPKTSGLDAYSSKVDKAKAASEKFSHVGWSMMGVTAGLGAAFLKGAKDAGELQKDYNYITNLAVTSGEKRVDALKNVGAMQKENTEISIKYGVSQTNLAKGDEELVHAGYSTNAALAAHKDLVQGAIASNQDYTSVMDNVTNVLDAYNLRTNDANKMEERTKMVTNQLAYSVDHGKSSFQDFGEALKFVGNSSHQANQHLSQTMSALTILSKNGIDGTLAGTGLRQVLNSFQSVGTGKNAGGQNTVMKKLGLSSSDFRDAHGKLKQISDLMKLMQSRIDSHHLQNYESSLMKQFFGATGQNVASTLAESAKSMKDLNDQIERSDKMKGGGYVQWLSKKNMQNAANQINVFKQSWNAFGTATATTILPSLTGVIKGLDALLLDVNKMPSFGKSIIAWGALVVAGISPVALLISSFKTTIGFATGSFSKFMALFNKRAGNNLGDSVNQQTQRINRDTSDIQRDAAKMQASEDIMNSGSSTDIPDKVLSRTQKMEQLSQVSRMTRFKSRFGGIGSTGTRLGQVADNEHLLATVGSDAGRFGKIAGFAGKGIAGVAAASSLIGLLGMNRHNAGSKLGGAGGTAAGGMIGAGIGSLADPFTFGAGTLVGGAAGSWLGGKGGSEIGKLIQKAIPNDAFKKLKTSWNSVVKWFGKTASEIGKPFKNAFSYIGKQFAPVGKSFSRMIGTISHNKDAQKSFKFIGVAAKASMLPMIGVFKAVGVAFKVAASVLKAVARGIGTTLKDEFGGLAKMLSGTFNLISDVMTFKWRRAGQDLVNIGKGFVRMMIAPLDGLKTAAESIFDDIKHSISGIMSSIGNAAKKVGSFASHPIKSIKSMFASGTQSKYPNGLPRATNAIVNDGTGPELIQIGNSLGIFKGRNVHTLLPKGSRVYNAEQTRSMVGVQHFAKGTESSTSIKTTFDNTANALKFRNSNKKSLKSINADTKKSNDLLSKQSLKQYSDMYTGIGKSTDDFRGSNSKELKGLKSDSYKVTDQLSDQTEQQFSSMFSNLNKQTDSMHASVIKKLNATEKDWQSVLQLFPKDAKVAMESSVDALNTGIQGIDSSLSQFGGNTSVLKPFHYANGSDGELTKDQLAMVNDATTGPRQEAILRRGNVILPKNKNQLMQLRKGDQVLNGRQTQKLMQNYTINHYAKGSGVSDSKLEDIAKNNAKSPNKFFNNAFVNKAKPEGPTLEKGLTGGIVNAIKGVGQSWSSAMWGLIENTISGDGGGSGSMGAFLKYAEKIGMGKKYVMGAIGPDAYDCSGLIYTALKHFGIDIGRNTVAEQSSSGVTRLGKDISKAKVGDLAIFGHGGGASGHVGIISNVAKGLMMNATPPSGRISSIKAAEPYVPGGLDAFYHINGLHSDDDKKNKTSGILSKLVKSQLGKKALDWITKHLGQSDMGGGAGGDSPAPTGSHEHWLKQAGISSSDFSAANYIISHESGWNPHATNPDGGAYGLPQSLPGDKMASAGSDWRNNPITQLKWMKSYVNGRYGGFQQAQAYWESHHNYANGGWANKPSTFGEVPGEPEVAINPKRNSADRLINEAITARAKVTGKPLATIMQQKHNKITGKTLMNRLSSLLANKKKSIQKPQINVNQTINFNVNGNIDDSRARQIARIVREELQKAAYNAGNSLGLNEV